MKKRALIVLLSACMLSASVPYPAFAADTAAASTAETGMETAAEEEPSSEEESAVEEETAAEEAAAEETDTRNMDDMTEADNKSLADSDTLFREYIDRQFAVSSGEGIRRAPRRNRFSGQNGVVYDKLKSVITDIADGTQSSAVISIPVSELLDNGQMAYTRSELGLGENAEIEEGYKALLAKVDVDNSAVYDALLDDLPYDLYWLDKTQGTSMGKKGSYGYSGGKFYFGDNYVIFFQLPVSADYSAGGTAGEYETDTAKTSAASTAAQNAQDIVSSETGDSDNAVLTDFKDKICSLVSYNTDATCDSDTNYGNPWQLIYVFDNDPETKVVCEGYAKAFKYLCDLYRTMHGFTDSDLDVYTVTGVMQGSTGAGRHMWNIVQTSKENYLADITNSDEGTVGKDGSLFMVSVDGYVMDSEGRTTGYTAGKVTYTYDSDMLEQYDEDEIGFNKDYDSHKEYAVNMTSGENGAVSADKTSAALRQTVTLTVSPETGYELDSLAVWNGSKSIKVTNSGNGTYTFVMPAGDVTVTASFKKSVVKVTGVTVTPFTADMTVGDETTLKASVRPDDATDKTVTWSSSDENVATVDGQGTVTALSRGITVITATANDGSEKQDSCIVIVSPKEIKVTGVIVEPSDTELTEGDREKLNAVITPFDATNSAVRWTSGNEAVATVSGDGIVTAVSKGTATITATAEDGSGVSGSCKITVKPKEVKVSEIAVTVEKDTLKVDDTTTAVAAVTPENATDKGVAWSSSDEKIVTVDDSGKITAVSAGTATITATAKDGSGVRGEYVITVGHKYTFTDVTDPANSYYDAVYWAADKGITTGYSDGTFGVSKNCSRGAFVTFLWRQQGSPEPTLTAEKSGLKDFNSIGKSYQKAVLWAVEKGITTGYSDKTFRASANVTRGAAVTFLWRAAGQPKVSITRKDVTFKDMVPAGSSFEKGILWAVENKITTGYKKDNTFRPANNCTRGATVTFLKRFDELK